MSGKCRAKTGINPVKIRGSVFKLIYNLAQNFNEL